MSTPTWHELAIEAHVYAVKWDLKARQTAHPQLRASRFDSARRMLERAEHYARLALFELEQDLEEFNRTNKLV